MSLPRIGSLLVIACVFTTEPAAAQSLGTFRWQLQPYCNLITVHVTQTAGVYTLDGTDDRCGAAQAASIVGVAFLNPTGLVGFGLSEVLPGGTAVHTEATINMSSLSGTWRDSAGNSGTFVFTPGSGAGGSPRTIPAGSGLAPGSVTMVQIGAGAVGGSQLAPNSIDSTHVVNGSLTSGDLADSPRSAFTPVDSQSLPLTGLDQVVRSVTITAPAAGTVVVNASGFFQFGDPAVNDSARCAITTGTVANNEETFWATEATANAIAWVPFAGTRGFTVIAGPNTFNLVCNLLNGTVLVWRSFMTATYTP